MSRLLRCWIPVTLVLMVPVLPFLAFGPSFEDRVECLLTESVPRAWACVLVVASLGIDIFLPIPSSVVGTWAGATLGVWVGTLMTWTGLTVGAVAGFWLARLFGKRFAHRFANPRELDRLARTNHRFGPLLIVATRAVPILAEAGVLAAGLHHLAWHRFLWPLMFSNLGIALAYSMLGEVASRQKWLPFALALAAAAPLFVAVFIVSLLRTTESGDDRTPVPK